MQQAIVRNIYAPLQPKSFEIAVAATGYAATAARQTTLEPGSGGIDVAMSWSCWLWVNNYTGDANLFSRIFQVAENNSNLYQFTLQLVTYSSSAVNGHIGFVLQNAANTANISCYTDAKINRARWYHVVITYSGSELNTGINIYLNGVQETGQRFSAGSYAGVGSVATYRFMISHQNEALRRVNCFMKDLSVWNRVLTSDEVLEAYNSGHPLAPSSLSFYATAIRAYFPLATDVTCTNNAALNLTANGMSFSTTPIRVPQRTLYNWGGVSCWNAFPGNTAYLAFGNLFKAGDNIVLITRSGTSHLSNGKIVRATMNKLDFTVNALSDVIAFSVTDRRVGSAGVVGGDIIINTIDETNGAGTVISNTKYTSTDGLTGSTYDGGSAITTPLTNGGFYGKIVQDYDHSQYRSMFYAESGGTYTIYLATLSGGTWSFTSIHSSSAGATRLVEPCLIKCGNNTYIVLARSVTADLYILYSTDGGATWSSPAATGLATGIAMADGCITSSGRLQIIWGDRVNDSMYMSLNNNVSTVIGSPTAWTTPIKIFQSYTTDSLGILGYPSIVADGYNAAVCFSAEFSSSRADLIFGYGQVDLG